MYVENTKENLDLSIKRWEMRKLPNKADFLLLESERGWRNLESSFQNCADVCASFGDEIDSLLFRSNEDLCSVLSFVSSVLKDKGLFFGISFDSSEIWARITKSQIINRSFFTTQKDLLRLEFEDTNKLYHYNNEGGVDDFSSNIGISYNVLIENRKQSNYMIHNQTLINVAKHYGLYLVDMTNCAEYYQTQKHRWFEELKRMNVFAKPKNNILPEQKDALSLYTTFVFQKICDSE